jgi:hypothetical protein
MRATRPAVIDTSLMLALSGAGALERLLCDTGCDWRVTPIAYGEVASHATHDILDRAIGAGRVHLAAIETTDQSQMNEWARWELVVDVGQAEVIALALMNGWVAGLEDRHAQRALDRDAGPGHWTNTASLLLNAVQDGALSNAEAEELFAALDSYRGYCRRGAASLAKLQALIRAERPLGYATRTKRERESRG